MSQIIESYVNLDVPGFDTVDVSENGSAWSTVTIGTTGFVTFRAYLDLCTAAVTGYTFTYSSTTDRCTLTIAGAALSLYFRFITSTPDTVNHIE